MEPATKRQRVAGPDDERKADSANDGPATSVSDLTPLQLLYKIWMYSIHTGDAAGIVNCIAQLQAISGVEVVREADIADGAHSAEPPPGLLLSCMYSSLAQLLLDGAGHSSDSEDLEDSDGSHGVGPSTAVTSSTDAQSSKTGAGWSSSQSSDDAEPDTADINAGRTDLVADLHAQAWSALEHALALCPTNAQANMLAGSLLRRRGDLKQAWRMYCAAADVVPTHLFAESESEAESEEDEVDADAPVTSLRALGDGDSIPEAGTAPAEASSDHNSEAAADPTDAAEWYQTLIEQPRGSYASEATFYAALLGAQLLHHDVATRYVAALGMRVGLAAEVWRAAASPSTFSVEKSSNSPVHLFPSALPPALLASLRHGFRPDAAFWSESRYSARGYYSFWYPLAAAPRTAVEAAVQVLARRVLSEEQRGRVVGAEWWVHTRPAGRNSGHQMHFDTEEVLLNAKGRLCHPIVSSVVYLTGQASGGGPTLVLQQRADATEPASEGWMVHPRDGAMLTFPGDLLHCVLPGAGTGSGEEPAAAAAHRLTLMVGWWGEDITACGVERKLYGPAGPTPASCDEECKLAADKAHSCTSWPRELPLPQPELAEADLKPCSSSAEAVLHVAPVWEEVAAATGQVTLPPPHRSIDPRFFVTSATVFGEDVRDTLAHAVARNEAAAKAGSEEE